MPHGSCHGAPAKKTLILLLTITLIIPGTLSSSALRQARTDPILTSAVKTQVTIPPNSDYIIAFNATNQTLTPEHPTPLTDGLNQTVINAIAKCPHWLQPDLTRQFHTITDPQPYADLLINASTQYIDEIAFSLAECPSGKIPSPALLLENAQTLYDNDQWIQYAEIKDFDDDTGNHYSTIQYTILDNGTPQTFFLPPEIYYWYVVHPKLTRGEVDATYGPLWRTYLTNHNDLGYPLLKEKLQGIQYLWDAQAYFQPALRLWSPSIQAHPTAIEAVSYWVGKTVPNQAIGDRPGKPSIIAHEHNGWCGELQSIAVAAQRAALIPSIPALNVGEDHVWREFYHQGWHENDNWWSDGGGAVDEPDIYGYGWGKNMSSIYTWRGDDTIQDDTARYIHDEDRITVSFDIRDGFLQPVDGARITVLVKGPKDITYYKDLVWNKIQAIWDRLPDLLKGKLLTALFAHVQEKFDAIPDVVKGVTITVWNYTDLSGHCSFQLGKNMEYLFLIQSGNLRKPWQLARHNVFRSLSSHEDKTFTVALMEYSHRPSLMIPKKMPAGDCHFSLEFSSQGYQRPKNFLSDGIGTQDVPGLADCFWVDTANLAKYQAGKPFVCYSRVQDGEGHVNCSAPSQDWFVVIRNHGRLTSLIVDVALLVWVPSETAHVDILSLNEMVYETPLYEVGTPVILQGIATGPVTLMIGCEEYALTPVDGYWSYVWNTTGEVPNRVYEVIAFCGDASDSVFVKLQDRTPSDLTIAVPQPGLVIERGFLYASGSCSDNCAVGYVEGRVDNDSWVRAEGTLDWNILLDCTGVSLGDHPLQVRAVDEAGLMTVKSVWFAVNEAGHSWGPEILSLVQEPAAPVNTSNIIVYANVSSSSPYRVSSIALWYTVDGSEPMIASMYRYGDFPVQPRHEEDPLRNESNLPVYGVELGQFTAGTTVSYWVVAGDTAGNTRQSEVQSFTIGP